MKGVAGGVTTTFVPDVNTPLPTMLESHEAATTRYLYGLDLLAERTGTEWLYYHTDALGSTRLLTNGLGQPVGTSAYAPFGSLLYSDGPAVDFGFTGEQYDDPTGLYFLRARYYDPRTGRFTQRDPLAGMMTEPQTLNPYAYGINNPVRFSDPSGYCIDPDYCPLPLECQLNPQSSECSPGTPVGYNFENLQQKFRNWQFTRCYLGNTLCKILISSYDFFSPLERVEMLTWSITRGISCDTQGWTDALMVLGENVSDAPFVLLMGDVSPLGGVYSIRNPDGLVVRVGRTNDLLRREGEYYRDPNYFDLTYKPEFYTDDYAVQRGLEKMLYDKYQPPLNINRPIGLTNTNSANYMNAAVEFLKDLFGAH